MKKYAIVIVCAMFQFLSGGSWAQKIKHVDIWSKPLLSIFLKAHYSYDSANQLTNIYISLDLKNSKYPHLDQPLNVFLGGSTQFYKFILDVEKFYKENEPQTSGTIDGRQVDIVKQSGFKIIYIEGKKEDGYAGFNEKFIANIKEHFVEWATQNKIDFK